MMESGLDSQRNSVLLAEYTWASHFPLLSLSFLICEMNHVETKGKAKQRVQNTLHVPCPVHTFVIRFPSHAVLDQGGNPCLKS